MQDIAREVRGRRAVLKLSQREVAQRAGVGENVVGEIERAQGNPRLSTLVRLARALDARLADLVDF
jgi:transcriptional regulator with XRE-family HTH domain